jgi:3-deoxy-D-manno-octulosonate 8-phosphate phosphatase (KDO 8-P phosphatase)
LSNLLTLFKPITTFVFDVDGVLTDGNLFLFPGGEMVRRMSIKDGYALQLAVKQGYTVIIISGGISELVKERLLRLGVSQVFLGVTDKKQLLENYVAENKLSWNQVLFMGDDIPDLEVMEQPGLLACCPADAVPEIKKASQYISLLNGGMGCARDVIEKTLKLNDKWHHVTEVKSK